MMNKSIFRAIAVSTVSVAALALPAQAHALEYNIPAGSLRSALDSLGRQTALQLIFRPDEVRQVKSRGAIGAQSPEGALEQILKGTGFKVERDVSGAVIIIRDKASLTALAPKQIAYAQAAQPQADASSGQGGGYSEPQQSAGLADIVVTAQKRSENIQDIPIAVTAIGGGALERSVVLDTSQLTRLTPSLNYTNNGGFVTPFIRGIGSTISAPEAEASVATFVDGVYIANTRGLNINFLAVDRVEVLAGPQGTLYGRNASGGAINIYTLTPGNQLEAKVTAGYGNYNNFQMSGHVSGPISDTLSVGLYASGMHQDAFHKFVPDRAPGQKDRNYTWGVRGKAVWQPTDAAKLTATIERTEQESVDSGIATGVQTDALGYTLGATRYSGKYVVNSDAVQYDRSKVTLAILREEFDLGFANLVGISSYRYVNSPISTDLDGTRIVDSNGDFTPMFTAAAVSKSKQYSQEIQLVSQPGSPVSWIGGLYYFHERGSFDPLVSTSALLFPSPVYQLVQTTPGKTISYAAFAQATFPLAFVTDGLSLTLGGRVTHDKKVKLPDSTEAFDASGASLGPASGFGSASKSWTRFTPKVTLEYDTGPTLLYATYTKGFKSGGFNINAPGDFTPINPETLTDFEVGAKSELFDRRLRLNLSAYYYDFKGLQLQVQDTSQSPQVVNVLRNAAAAEAYGVELSSSAALTSRLTTDFTIAWEHSEYTDFPDAPYFLFSPNGNMQVIGHSATGYPLVQAPKVSLTWSGNYRLPLQNGGQIDLDGSFYHNSGFNWNPVGQDKQKAYSLLSASIQYTTPDQRWKFRVWGTNLTNEYYFGFRQISSVNITGNEAPPRMYGVSATWQY